MARTAVVAGTATAVSNRVSRRQGERWAQQDYEQQQQYEQQQYQQQQYQQAPPQYQEPAPAAPAVDPIEQLKELAQLKEQGILTPEEFAVQKAKILGS
jgi:hypothetical protein